MLFLASLIALMWSVTIALWLVKFYTGVALPGALTLVDGIIVYFLLRTATRPQYPGRPIFLWVVFLLFIQAMYRLHVTVFGTPTFIAEWLILGINSIFIIILVSVNIVSGLRILRLNFPATYSRIWHGIRPPKRHRVEFHQDTDESLLIAYRRFFMARAFPELDDAETNEAVKVKAPARKDA